jgi:RND family efflux transporter MFP subunit
MTSEPRPVRDPAGTEEERLRRENHELKRQLQELKAPSGRETAVALWRPSAITIWVIFLAACVVIAVAFVAGYLPLQKRRALIVAEEQEQERSLPRVEVVQVRRAGDSAEFQLPGSIEPIAEAPVLARADGYIRQRLVDIGDRVKAGQPLAEIEAPEVEEQIRQAKAALRQAEAGVNQAAANLKKGQSDTELSRVTAQRYASLMGQGVVARQDNDRYQAEYQSALAGVQALEEAVAVQRSNVAAAEASVARLERMQSYLTVKAPFDGVITLRNVDTGALATAGSTLLFRIAQNATLRTYVNVPQSHASVIRAGQAARVSVSNLPGREFAGSVVRTANALDPASRTLLVEIHVPNPDGTLLPGMYARVDLMSARGNAPLSIPAEALVVRADGASVAVVRPDQTVHMQKIEVGRDYGDRLEVMGGLQEGDWIIPNPGDAAREGLKVQPSRR